MCTIYIVVIPHLALRNYIALIRSHNPLWVCETHPEGRGSIWVDLLSRRNSAIRKSAEHSLRLRRAVSARYSSPRLIPHGVILGSPVIPRITLHPVRLCLSVSVSSFFFHIMRERPRARTHAETYVGDTWIFISVSPCPVARKYFLGSPLIYHNRRLSTRSRLWTPGQSRPSRAMQSRAIARVRNQLRP